MKHTSNRTDLRWRILSDQTDELRIQNLDLVTCLESRSAGLPQPPHAHEDMIEFHYLSQGFQVYRIDGTTLHLGAGDVYITYPGQLHGSDGIPMGRNTIYYLRLRLTPHSCFLNYTEEQGRIVLRALREVKGQVFQGNARLRDEFEGLLALMGRCGPERSLLVRNAVTALIFNLTRLSESRGRPTVSARISTALACADKGESLAHALEANGMSRSTFQHRFRQEVGVSYCEYALRCRMKQAMKLLMSTDQSLTRIALSLGFCSSQHFSAQFRRIAGVTPSSLRRFPGQSVPFVV